MDKQFPDRFQAIDLSALNPKLSFLVEILMKKSLLHVTYIIFQQVNLKESETCLSQDFFILCPTSKVKKLFESSQERMRMVN